MRNPPNSSSVFRSCSFDFFIHFLDFSNEFVPFCLRPGWHLKCKWLIRIIIIVIHPFRDNQICWLAIKGRGGAASGRKAKMKKGLRLLLYAVIQYTRPPFFRFHVVFGAFPSPPSQVLLRFCNSFCGIGGSGGRAIIN